MQYCHLVLQKNSNNSLASYCNRNLEVAVHSDCHLIGAGAISMLCARTVPDLLLSFLGASSYVMHLTNNNHLAPGEMRHPQTCTRWDKLGTLPQGEIKYDILLIDKISIVLRYVQLVIICHLYFYI